MTHPLKVATPPKAPLALSSPPSPSPDPNQAPPLAVLAPFSGPAPTGATVQAPGAAVTRTPGPTLWEKECTTPPGLTSNATVVGSDTASAGLNATAARSNAAHKLAPSPLLLLLGAAILGSDPQGRVATGRGKGHVGRPPEATSASARPRDQARSAPFPDLAAMLGRGLDFQGRSLGGSGPKLPSCLSS